MIPPTLIKRHSMIVKGAPVFYSLKLMADKRSGSGSVWQ
jgi:hypothetical protein